MTDAKPIRRGEKQQHKNYKRKEVIKYAEEKTGMNQSKVFRVWEIKVKSEIRWIMNSLRDQGDMAGKKK